MNSEETGKFLDGYLPHLLHRAYRLLSADFHTALDRFDADLFECRILNVLSDEGESSVTFLSDRANISLPSASKVCNRLVSRDLVTKRVPDGDRRGRLFKLTPCGQALSREISREAAASVGSITDGLSVQTELLQQLLADLIAELEMTTSRIPRNHN